MITAETALAIARAYQEIDCAEKLLAEIVAYMKDWKEPDIRDAFGRRVGGLQLGVPSGDNGRRLFHVEWSLAKPIIEAHIAQQKAILTALNEKARIETVAGGLRCEEG